MEAPLNMGVVDISLLVDVDLLGIMNSLVLRKRRPPDSCILSLRHIVKFILPSQVRLVWRPEVVHFHVVWVLVFRQNWLVVDWISPEVSLIPEVLFEYKSRVILNNISELVVDRIHIDELTLPFGFSEPRNLPSPER